MSFIILGLIFMVIGAIWIIIESRSFYAGLLFSCGVFITGFATFIISLDFLMNKFSNIGNLINMFAILIILSVFLFTIVYLISNTFIVQNKEGRSPTALLSLFLGINIFFIIPFPLWIGFLSNERIPQIIPFIVLLFCSINFILTLCFVFYLLYSVFYQFIPFKGKVHFIIVLGSGIKTIKVPPLLKSRLDMAIKYFKKNPDSKIIVSGGQGADEPVSEAYAMREYLLSQDIPDAQIIMEDQSTTTYENMRLSKNKIIKALGHANLRDINILFSTNNYHVFRAAVYTRKAKLKAQGVGAPTAHYFLPTALIREFIALLVMHKKSLLILTLLFSLLLAWTYFF
ncbi:YdcF family protein [Staphylococcus sp. IVB6238]|nr:MULTISPECIES: YdcF family protein [unclassified Staphylococcus]UXR73333.1 YdcF family protein [Staphylococcus sp. IVB6238]UXR77673.1 YdcF family protein [Staphylococcus sp. IVB6227]